MATIRAKGVAHGQACVRCGVASTGPYCPEHRPKNFDPSQPFWGGQGATAAQRRQRKRILQRDGYRCFNCGGKADQVHHLDAQARGGSDDDTNLVASCGPCNLSAGAPGGGVGS